MSTIAQEIEKHIKKLIDPLKEESELLDSLKVKLTKKELKLIKLWSDKTLDENIMVQLNIDKQHYKHLSNKLIKKLNQEKMKQSICSKII